VATAKQKTLKEKPTPIVVSRSEEVYTTPEETLIVETIVISDAPDEAETVVEEKKWDDDLQGNG
jgi:hypothetical protein